MSTQSGFRPDQEAMIAEQYKAGGTLAILARHWHCADERIRAALEATGTPLRSRGARLDRTFIPSAELEARNERILALAREGWTNAQLAAEFHLTHARICRLLQHADLPERRELAHADQATIDRAIVERYVAGDSVSRLVRDLKVGHLRVRQALAAAGIEQRTITNPPPVPPRKAQDITPGDTAPTIIGTRTCQACNITVHEADWPAHMAKVHGVVSKAQKQWSSVDTYLERVRLQAVVEPTRPAEPPCGICRRTPCEAPIAHARITRMRDQHARRMERERAGKKAA